MEIYERKSISMFVMILEKSPNFEDRGGEHSPPLILYMEKEKAKEDALGGRTSYL